MALKELVKKMKKNEREKKATKKTDRSNEKARADKAKLKLAHTIKN